MLATQQTLDQIGTRMLALAVSDDSKEGFAAVAAAGPSDDLDRNLGNVIQRAQSLKANVQPLKGRIDRVVALLDRPKQVAASLRTLSGELGTLATLLQVAQVVRVIRPAADMLRRQIDLLKRPRHGAGSGGQRDPAARPVRRHLPAEEHRGALLRKPAGRARSGPADAGHPLDPEPRIRRNRPAPSPTPTQHDPTRQENTL